MCSTKALLSGDGDVLSDIYRERVMRRGRGAICGACDRLRTTRCRGRTLCFLPHRQLNPQRKNQDEAA